MRAAKSSEGDPTLEGNLNSDRHGQRPRDDKAVVIERDEIRLVLIDFVNIIWFNIARTPFAVRMEVRTVRKASRDDEAPEFEMPQAPAGGVYHAPRKVDVVQATCAGVQKYSSRRSKKLRKRQHKKKLRGARASRAYYQQRRAAAERASRRH